LLSAWHDLFFFRQPKSRVYVGTYKRTTFKALKNGQNKRRYLIIDKMVVSLLFRDSFVAKKKSLGAISCHLGCQMVRLQTKNINLGKFWRVLQWKMLVYFKAIWFILWLSGILYGFLVHLKVIWYILPVLVTCSKKNLATLLVISECQSQPRPRLIVSLSKDF
jgi:hypothetical protein